MGFEENGFEPTVKNKRYYRERAAYMRRLAQEALTESLMKGCLRAAQEYERLAERADEDEEADQE